MDQKKTAHDDEGVANAASLSSTAAHTPGPWVFGNTSEDRRMILGGESERYVCNVQIYQTPRVAGLCDEAEREANARLIAAAPDMLAALEAMTAVAETQGPRWPSAT